MAMMLTSEQISELTVVRYPAASLSQRANRIEHLDAWVQQLAAKMIDLMHAHRGVGLAGNQVGLPLQIFTYNSTCEPGEDSVLINPEIIDESGWTESEEGCLSLPDVSGTIRRRRHVVVEGIDLSGRKVTLPADDLLARIMQHEMDHLHGTLICQRMSPVGKLAVRGQLKHLEDQARRLDVSGG